MNYFFLNFLQKPPPPLPTHTQTHATAENDLVCNFDEELVAVFAEAKQWDKFQGRYSTPSIIHDMMFQQEKLTNMRGKVLQVVRAYNTILADMNAGEKRLFHDKLRWVW